MAGSQKPALIAIVGPTASGKSKLAMVIASLYNGEIIAADSRTIYRQMNIGTAKPNKGEQRVIPHWGLDLVEPGQRFSAHQFKEYANKAIADIQSRGKLPILVGGTGLYIDAVLYDFDFRRKADPKLRQKLEKLSVEELQEHIKQNQYPMPQNLDNKRHLIRAIETAGQQSTKQPKPLESTLIVGLMPPDEVLIKNIHERVRQWFQTGLVGETQLLIDRYGEGMLPMAGIGYKAIADYLNGRISLSEAKRRFEREHWQYARRQKTWFRRNKFIQWFSDAESAFKYSQSVLNK